MRTPILALLALLTPLLASGCATLSSGGSGISHARIVDTRTGTTVSLDAVIDELATADVVFLGELHDSADAHAYQIALTRRLLERRGALIVSLEMFERDQQPILDRYLAKEIDEERFLADTRTWPNYTDDYRPVIELARERGLQVIASNVPRPLAARVAREGINAVMGEEFTPRQVHVAAGPYKVAFQNAMGGLGERMGGMNFDDFFAAQCIKDDAMAESIADALLPLSLPRPVVVHWCGAFHSDFDLGTVERLRSRMPGLEIVVLSTVRPEDADHVLTEEELAKGRYLFVVRR